MELITPPTNIAGEGIEMVHMSDAFYGTVQRGNLKRVMAQPSDIEKYAVYWSDLVVARRSLNLEGAAKPCLIPKAREPLLYESSFIRVRPKQDIVTSVYLFHYLSHPLIRKKELNRFTQSTISGINQSNLSKVRVFIPSNIPQRKFVGFIEKMDINRFAFLKAYDKQGDLFGSLQSNAFSGCL
jgi:type I restriction enzyme S subunit